VIRNPVIRTAGGFGRAVGVEAIYSRIIGMSVVAAPRII
jgi:hypothetical protein